MVNSDLSPSVMVFFEFKSFADSVLPSPYAYTITGVPVNLLLELFSCFLLSLHVLHGLYMCICSYMFIIVTVFCTQYNIENLSWDCKEFYFSQQLNAQ